MSRPRGVRTGAEMPDWNTMLLNAFNDIKGTESEVLIVGSP